MVIHCLSLLASATQKVFGFSSVNTLEVILPFASFSIGHSVISTSSSFEVNFSTCFNEEDTVTFPL